ncbi:acyl carrier protein [Candidatus Pantoea formicae]|uniref:acyl carrier protein n=1 Tax=Candidatus Pantoea formicae TaxID=2608355 RepID=UPI003ED9D9CE
MNREVSVEPTFQQVIDFVREFSGDVKSVITEHTRLEADLGITGDDGVELLEEVEKQFGVSFVTEERSFKETFGLGENEYLFNAEGGDWLGVRRLIGWIRKEPRCVVRDLTVGELWQVLVIVKRQDSNTLIVLSVK